MNNTIRIGLDLVQQAVEVRASITEHYRTYATLSKIVQTTALVEHADFKNAVDALYYLGGGWPTENSKGRMECLLDNFTGMYKILTLIGSGYLVENYLEKKGIKVTLTEPIQNVPLSTADVKLLNEEFEMIQFGFKPSTLSELVSMAVNEARHLQRFICENADKIKKELKPQAKQQLAVEDEEFDRLFTLTKFRNKSEKVTKTKNAIENSVSHFKTALRQGL